MDFSLTPDQQTIREAVLNICGQFSDDYWFERDAEGDGDGFKNILKGLNPERVLPGAEA